MVSAAHDFCGLLLLPESSNIPLHPRHFVLRPLRCRLVALQTLVSLRQLLLQLGSCFKVGLYRGHGGLHKCRYTPSCLHFSHHRSFLLRRQLRQAPTGPPLVQRRPSLLPLRIHDPQVVTPLPKLIQLVLLRKQCLLCVHQRRLRLPDKHGQLVRLLLLGLQDSLKRHDVLLGVCDLILDLLLVSERSAAFDTLLERPVVQLQDLQVCHFRRSLTNGAVPLLTHPRTHARLMK
mmetsp:Transcript_10316/g.26224  ORF Transcript_10316/g.26224 Transcript_10316/m.26224 type:complete len:233 (+) Transcript_10316:1008-1706(+)